MEDFNLYKDFLVFDKHNKKNNYIYNNLDNKEKD